MCALINYGDHVLDFVDDYLHEALSATDAKMLRRHCDECRICSVALEEAQKRFDAIAALSAAEASEELIQKTLKRIEHIRFFDRFTKTQVISTASSLVIASAALILLFVNIHYATLTPTPYNLVILGQNEWISGTDGALRIRLVNRSTGEALEGVPVEVELVGKTPNQLIHLVSFTTNTHGSGQAKFSLPDWDVGTYELRVRAFPEGEEELLTESIKLKRSWKLMLSTDKPVYQPGQMIHIRSLALKRPDLKPVSGHDVEFSISDPKGNVIFRKQDVTSDYGIASIDCQLANEILHGSYQVQCQVGEVTSRMAVEVQKYVLPKFKVDLTLDRPYYEPGKMVRGTVSARYFFGKPVAGADVQIALETTMIHPQNINIVKIKTDAKGKAKFEFRLPEMLVGRPQDSHDARFTVLTTVTDSAGQKHSVTASRIATNQPIRIEVLPEAGTLVRGIENRVYLLTRYADGRPAQTRVAITGQDSELQTNPLGVASIDLVPKKNTIRLTIRATDAEDIVGRRDVNLTCGNVVDDFIVRTDKAVYQGGDTMELLALGSGTEPVFVDMIKDGQTLLTKTIQLAKGRGNGQIDLPAELFGTLRMCAYRFNRSGVAVRKTHVIYVRQARELQIRTVLDRKEYRPGKRAKLNLTLVDDQGTPTPGAISLAAVDEAVFSVLSQRPGMEKMFFTLDEELLKPVYEIHPSWTPARTAGTAGEDRVQLEKALFSRTAGALDSPTQWRELADGFWEGDIERTPHTLSAASFSTKDRQVRGTRSIALGNIKTAWIILGILAATGVTVFLFRTVAGGVLVVIILIVFVLSGLLLPAVQKVREAARRGPPNAPRDWANEFDSEGVVPDTKKPVAMATLESPNAEEAAPLRVRQWFPETLLWRPELITDDQGLVTIDVDLADSITDWRLTASAISAQGQLGASQSSLRVFQPFFVDLNLPVALTRGDEIDVPVVVHNHLKEPQTIELQLEDADEKTQWFELVDEDQNQPAVKKINVPAGEVRQGSFRIRVKRVGVHKLGVSARGSGVADAIRREIEVVPDGKRIDQVHNGNLQEPVTISIVVPDGAIEGSAKAILKIYPSGFSQVIEGLDGIFRRPYGCFEQTSSTTYPNVLALDYLRQIGKSIPAVEVKARQYIHLGYQRLLTFEIGKSGGFDWFGRPPANRTLTAYGLMEFKDMARVHDVDPQLIKRTTGWLLSQQKPDGSWDPEDHRLHDDPTRGAGQLARLSTTAYIAWAVFDDTTVNSQAQRTLDFLQKHSPASIESPYVLALVSSALLAIDSKSPDARAYLDRLDSMKRTSPDGKLIWWEQPASSRTMFYGAGRSGNVETTATAALAMITAGRHPTSVTGALSWLISKRDGNGTWHSTQATVLAIKALLSGSGKQLGGDTQRKVDLAIDGKLINQIVISKEENDVMRQINLSDLLATGRHTVTLTDRGGNAPGYQLALSYHMPEDPKGPAEGPLSISLAYDKDQLRVGQVLSARATVVNNMSQTAPMVILDLPIPAGFAIETDSVTPWIKPPSAVARYQVTPRSIIVYLRGLEPGQPLVLEYQLRATTPVKITVPAAKAYEYYDPDKRAASRATRMTVTART